MEQACYRFPYECVPAGSRIILYGAGSVGQAYLRQVLGTGYGSIVCLADKCFEKFARSWIPVISPDCIADQSFDVIVLALKSDVARCEVRRFLLHQGIEEGCIVEYRECGNNGELVELGVPRPQRYPRRMLIYLGGGIGDCIVTKKIIETFLLLAPDIYIDIDCTEDEHGILSFLYQTTPQVQNITIQPLFAYELAKRRYQVALYFHGSIWTRVDWLAQPCDLPDPLLKALTRMQRTALEENYRLDVPSSSFVYRSIYAGETCYQHLAAGGVHVQDFHVRIPVDGGARSEFEKMGLLRYVTVNYGTGPSSKARTDAKLWPKERWEALIRLIHHADSKLQIVQLGGKNAVPLDGADVRVFGASFGLVREVLAHSLLHLDTEGMLVHFATQLGTMCVVLFGPTQLPYFGYMQNINLQAGGCHGCHYLYPKKFSCCARSMEEPECMYSITPEMVMEAVRGYLDSLHAK